MIYFLFYLESDSGNITDGVTLASEAGDQDLVVLLDVVQATVTRHERRDLLAVLDQLHPHALADGGVGLLGFNASKRKRKLISKSKTKNIYKME